MSVAFFLWSCISCWVKKQGHFVQGGIFWRILSVEIDDFDDFFFFETFSARVSGIQSLSSASTCSHTPQSGVDVANSAGHVQNIICIN